MYGGGAALSKAFGLITSPLLGRYFSVEDYGTIAEREHRRSPAVLEVPQQRGPTLRGIPIAVLESDHVLGAVLRTPIMTSAQSRSSSRRMVKCTPPAQR